MKCPGFNRAVFAAGWLIFVAVLPSAAMHSLQQSGAIVADAAMRSDMDAVRNLLRGGADANASQGDGMSALHWAAQNGDSNIAEALIYAGANLEATTRLGGYTPLHLAARAGRGQVARTLIVSGANVDAPTTTGEVTPLHFAAGSGDVEAVKVLLEHGASANAREAQWGQTPLMFAAAKNRNSTVRELLLAGADPLITAKVVDISAREEMDRADQRDGSSAGATLALAQQSRSCPVNDVRCLAQVSASRERDAVAPAKEGQQQVAPTGFAERERLLGTTEIDPLSYADLVSKQGGLTALLLAAREGHQEAVESLLAGGADIDQVSVGDHTSSILMAAINGHFDLMLNLLDNGADPTIASDAGATPLYGVLNTHWQPKTRHPQPTDYRQQEASYLAAMTSLLEAGADVNARLNRPLWYTTYNNDLLRTERTGATAFWRAAYATDIDAMRLLLSYGADPTIPTVRGPSRSRFNPERLDPSGLPPVPLGGPAVYPIHAASGAGYGQGFAANAHRHVPDSWLATVRFLVEELGAEVNVRDVNGYNAIHHAAARGDNELILYLVERGGDVTVVSRRGQTTVDMANGPVQRTQPFPATIALLERLGAKNNHNCVSC